MRVAGALENVPNGGRQGSLGIEGKMEDDGGEAQGSAGGITERGERDVKG